MEQGNKKNHQVTNYSLPPLLSTPGTATVWHLNKTLQSFLELSVSNTSVASFVVPADYNIKLFDSFLHTK